MEIYTILVDSLTIMLQKKRKARFFLLYVVAGTCVCAQINW